MKSFPFDNREEFLRPRDLDNHMSLLKQLQSQQQGTQRCICSSEPGTAKGTQGNGVPARTPSVPRHMPQNAPGC